MLSPTRTAQLQRLIHQPGKAAPSWLTIEMVRDLNVIAVMKVALMLAIVRRELNELRRVLSN